MRRRIEVSGDFAVTVATPVDRHSGRPYRERKRHAYSSAVKSRPQERFPEDTRWYKWLDSISRLEVAFITDIDGTFLRFGSERQCMSVTRRAFDRVRQPEYTGENRCIPCTVTNLVIAVVLAGVLAWLWVPAGVAFFLVAIASIWLRGYLVPGTPELTKRYFPDWLLAKFDKLPEPEPIPSEAFDAESILLDGGVVEPCAEVDDLCLTAAFDDAWSGRIRALRDEATLRTELTEQLGIDDEVSFESHGGAYVAESTQGRIGQWESRAALLADLAAARELPEWLDDWERLSARQRSQLLGGLRVFVEQCPTCDGPVTADTEVVESCCRSSTVVAVTCDDCDSRLLEAPYNEKAAA